MFTLENTRITEIVKNFKCFLLRAIRQKPKRM